MINLETPKKFGPSPSRPTRSRPRCSARSPASTTSAEHAYPKELDMLAALIDGMNEGADMGGAGAAGVRRASNGSDPSEQPQRLEPLHRARHHRALLGRRRPAALDAAPGPRQLRDRLGGDRGAARDATAASGRRWRSPSPKRAPTRPRSAPPPCSTATSTSSTARRSSSPSGDRADLIVVWATLDRSKGRAAIKSFIVERDNPGLKLERLEHKLGIRASDTANFRLQDCRVPKEALLGDPEIEVRRASPG